MRAIITCVDYEDFLRITLPRTMEHFESGVIVTTPENASAVAELCESLPWPSGHSCTLGQRPPLYEWRYFATDAFYKGGAKFNKGAALDAALERFAGDWTCVLDADIYLPKTMDLSKIERGHLYSPHRRMMEKPGAIPSEEYWQALPCGPEHRNGEYAGFYHLFHADDLQEFGPPWYDNPIWRTAQGCDTVFWRKWGIKQARRLPFEVLHLGPNRVNWAGRISERWQEPKTN